MVGYVQKSKLLGSYAVGVNAAALGITLRNTLVSPFPAGPVLLRKTTTSPVDWVTG